MTESKKPMARDSLAIDDDAPDLTESPWAEKLTSAPVVRGRPKSEQTKVSTTIRLDADVLEGFRAGRPGWQSRINDVLKAWLARR
ncbi:MULTISPECIES: BrnA antitoxin family protein [unclassified Neorhizobium]|uniref:BrnA antitoxin family protein n=1 Tax=unclassified Neorhizobium TaxID=2629175 RepID=UPI001FF69EB4|nr:MULTISPECIES: BrnA antitoxin family protein [unclassified Neorhizobium]MCJ9673771.1 BrnA antitoxin family protein [Neorhizobium sp. SHOUNA12B]MCJ9747541.1 BrnA antitoxin family protein [Neorhizobium sp. SHOUNA12A]